MSMVDNKVFQKPRHPLKTFSLGLQHVLAMYAGAVIVPLIVSSQLGFTQEQTTYLVAIDLLMCGIATLLQVFTNRFFGIGMPVVLGCAFQAVMPMIAIGSEYDIPYIYGSILAMGLFVILFGGWFGKMIRFFPPVVTGSVVTIIGITLIPVAFGNLGGGQGSPDFGSPDNLMLGFGVLIFIVLLNKFSKGFMRAISVLIGLLIGTLAAALMGKVDIAPVLDASWFHAVQPFYFGMPKFNPTAILTMIIVAMVGIAESTGVFMALSKIVDRDIDSKDLARGYRAEGLAIFIGGLFNAFPYTTFSQNVGLIQMSRVKTRDVIVVAGGLLMLLGFVPKIAALTLLIPDSVLGGAMVAMFGMVISSGLRMIGSQVDLNRHENLFVIACSVGMGLGVTAVPGIFDSLPDTVRILTDNGIVAGTFTALVMNLLFNGVKPETAEAKTQESDEETIVA